MLHHCLIRLSKILLRFFKSVTLKSSNITKEHTRIGNCYIGYQILPILPVFILTFLNLWFQPDNSRFEVRDCSPRTSWHGQWLSCCQNTSGWRPWYQERLVLKFPSVNVFNTRVLIEGTVLMSPSGDETSILRSHPNHVKVSPYVGKGIHFSVIVRHLNNLLLLLYSP